MSKNRLISIVLNSFKAEQSGDIEKGLDLITQDYKVTEMYLGQDGKPFPSLSGGKVKEAINKVYKIRGRKYQFQNILVDEEKEIVVVEWVESYVDPKTGHGFLTPIMGVFEIKGNKINRARHYTDPRLSYKYLNQEVIDEVFK